MSHPVQAVPEDFEVKRAAMRIRYALQNMGVQPDYHAQLMARHRREWPALWLAIDELMVAAFPGVAMVERPQYSGGDGRRVRLRKRDRGKPPGGRG